MEIARHAADKWRGTIEVSVHTKLILSSSASDEKKESQIDIYE